MQIQIPEKILVINDMAGIGRCSMSVALPVISACGVQACPLPTAIFSNHLGFDTHYKQDLTDTMVPYMNQLNALNVSFNGVYCGFLSSTTQMDYVQNYLTQNTSLHAKQILIDPVMGDHGITYKSITKEFCERMKTFVSSATIITPNITEACLLTNTPYKESGWTEDELLTLAAQLHALGPNQIIITGMKENGYFHNFVYESSHNYHLCTTPIGGSSRPGTGDLFASIISGLCIKRITLTSATKIASDFIALCTQASEDALVPVKEGVIFESYLSHFMRLIPS